MTKGLIIKRLEFMLKIAKQYGDCPLLREQVGALNDNIHLWDEDVPAEDAYKKLKQD